MATFNNLEGLLQRRLNRFKKKLNKATIKIAVIILKDLVFVTPVDTSRALSNWQVRILQGATTEISPYSLGQRGSTKSASAVAALQTGQTILNIRSFGKEIYISNLLDYIADLNRGSSRQQPAGFVERAVLIGRVQASRIRVRI